ncbi:hypothetical protein QBC47DRAFT_149702 [Echria macrotheca]|uniref:Secreted protein n=1 Tax=Echria macrotheca TaxID=438768 RepID=A0AAJ0BI54_9PEZI|nr:hypothetical protein QBC47DRAFT_149702 [Echria macrotheca]
MFLISFFFLLVPVDSSIRPSAPSIPSGGTPGFGTPHQRLLGTPVLRSSASVRNPGCRPPLVPDPTNPTYRIMRPPLKIQAINTPPPSSWYC